MLDIETKRRIDTARDILVGKVPDPKSQVEQITIALIYKFMDDMDAEAEDLGGSRSFFANSFSRYGWARLMHSGLGGHDMLNLYADAISTMPENPGVPPLFREIFKNAFLPYRDPETLRSFLKVIDEFDYDHSERLGDAFEYLLSVLGSQGDAGQFRTPRHIIDFIVSVIDPKKQETVLDPACGTAGFLISAYKHILKANSSSSGITASDTESAEEAALDSSLIPSARGDLLTPDERARLATNFKGYDISPDMVRLSLVNMYLHGFTEPHIYEYDTLTSEERWSEHADVILANPPFMSPKGGIKPHNRFSVQSKRSEVLFVDYMAEHLTSSGRAGIIVPDGVMFQSQSAYTQLRRMLVDEYLVAVVSLPAGVFNPYSGVKTSILILDKALAKETGTIGFFKVENDGFNLGAQRRPIDKDDLPQARAEIVEYLHRLRTRALTADFQPGLGLIVPKETIAANGDYSLNADRYRENAPQTGAFPWRKIESLVNTVTPPARIQKTAFAQSGRFPIIDQSQERIAGWTDDEAAVIRPSKPLVIFGDHTCALKLVDEPFAQGADGIKILETLDLLDPRYLFHVIRLRPLECVGYQRHFALLKQMEIPLPPLDVQKQIVTEIEGYQQVIDGASTVLDNYHPRIPINPDWPHVVLGEALTTSSGGTPLRGRAEFYDNGTIPWLKSGEVGQGVITSTEERITEAGLNNSSAKVFPTGTVLVAMYGATAGQVGLLGIDAATNQAVCGILPDPTVVPAFLYYHLLSRTKELVQLSAGGAQPNISQKIIRSLIVPLPSVSTQQAIVEEIKAEEALVNANRELIARMERKIQATLSRIWDGDKPEATEA